MTAQTSADRPAQLRGISAQCEKRGIPRPTSFAYPGTAITKGGLAVLKDNGITFARRGGSPEYPYKEGRGFAYEPGLDHALLVPSAGDARPAWTLDDFKAAVAQAKHGKIAVLQFHGVPDTAHDWVNSTKEQFESYMKYLSDNKFTVIAMRDLAKYVDPAVINDRSASPRTQASHRGEGAATTRARKNDTELKYWIESARSSLFKHRSRGRTGTHRGQCHRRQSTQHRRDKRLLRKEANCCLCCRTPAAGIHALAFVTA